MKKLIFSTLCAGLLSAMTVSAADYPGFASSPNYTPNPAMNTPSFRGQSQYASSPNYTPIPGYASYPGFASSPGYASSPSYASNPGVGSYPGFASSPGYASSPSYASNPNVVNSFRIYFENDGRAKPYLLIADVPEEKDSTNTGRQLSRLSRALFACNRLFNAIHVVSFQTVFPARFPIDVVTYDAEGNVFTKTYYSTPESPIVPGDLSVFSELQCGN